MNLFKIKTKECEVLTRDQVPPPTRLLHPNFPHIPLHGITLEKSCLPIPSPTNAACFSLPTSSFPSETLPQFLPRASHLKDAVGRWRREET